MTRTWALSGDLARPAVILACALGAVSVALLLFELFRSRRGAKIALAIGATGALAVGSLLAAVLRPVAIVSKGSLVGPKVIVLADASRSIDLPGIDGTRRQAIDRALGELDQRAREVRFSLLSFGAGAPVPVDGAGAPPSPLPDAGGSAASTGSPRLSRAPFRVRPLLGSDLGAALEAIGRAADERPAALVVLSDGRLDRPGETNPGDAVKAALGSLSVPVHTVALAEGAPRDASVRKVIAAGAAVAHQPFSLRIEVGCSESLSCDNVPVVARELREQGGATTLASGAAHVVSGTATIELSMTIERAGTRILEIEIQAPDGDTIPDNNRRYITLDVTRERVRVLHVAGRPTYDVRALRMWLKSDASVDVVAFFILRTPTDDVHASQDELALIPFPVDELFNEHLPSFDAVVLQDFNAEPYGLTKHLPSLARYVDKGGGLIMVGGPDAFGPGHYGGTKLAEVLPVEISAERGASGSSGRRAADPGASSSPTPGSDPSAFTPRITEAGRAAPVLGPLRALIGEELPEMPGTNIVGDARPDATVLLVHPTRTTKSGAPMPILALGERGSGRTMPLTIDGSHRLLFSAFAASAAGRAHGAFWDAMLGWLMRDPRFEPAIVEVRGGCIAGEDATLLLRPLPGPKGEATVKVQRLGSGETVLTLRAEVDGNGGPIELPAGKLEAGGYSALVEIGSPGAEGPGGGPRASGGARTRRDFACEKGGEEWADSRPDEARLAAIAAATGGTFVRAPDAGKLPLPAATQVASERQVSPIFPPWAWTLGAAVLLGAHWIVRRQGGLA